MTIPDLPAAVAPNLTGALRLDFRDALVRRDLTVVRVEDVSPRYRRIVFGGDGLAEGFPLVRFAPGDHVKLYFPHPQTGLLVSYRATGDDDEWEVDGEGDPIRRDYTPRAWDAGARELTIDFVLHDHGIAGRWASRARAGDRLVAIGPRAHWILPEDYAHYLAVGDETALPSISRLLAEAPDGSSVTAVIEIADAGEEQPLGGTPGRTVQWVHRDTAPVGEGRLSALETAVRELSLPDPGELFVFAAGETGAMKPIRRYFRRELGLPKRQVVADGYWKRGATDFDHHTAGLDD